MSISRIFLYLCLSFIGGVFVSSLLKLPQSLWLGILILGSILIIFSSILKKKKLIIFGFFILFISLGIYRHQVSIFDINSLNNYYDKEIMLEGVIVEEPERRIDKVQIQIKNKDIPGKILITTELYPKYNYGDKLKITGKLQKPIIFDDFNYRSYLAKDKIYLVAYYPKIYLISKNESNLFYANIFKFKNKIREVIDKVLLPPQSSILKAILLGDKYILSDSLKEKLNETGTRHIVAISGLHMIIISQILLFLALGIGLWRGQAFYFVLAFLIIYIIMIGAPASALRAGIMAGLLLLSQKLGRLNSSLRSIIFAGTIMLFANPLLLKHDAGFQLSFTAVLSIGYLKPIIDGKIKKIPNFLGLKDILVMTLSAQIGVLPLLIYHFGQFSLISPIANLLIVPVLPFIMISGIIMSLSGLIYLPLAKLFSIFVWFLLSYVVEVAGVLGG